MYLMILIAVSVLPIYLLGKLIYNMDQEKEPKKLLKELLFSGAFSCVLVIMISFTLGDIIPLFTKEPLSMNFFEKVIYSFLCVGLVEEGCKYLMLYVTTYHHKEFNFTFDMIVYAVFVSLGFALLENVFYVFSGGLFTGILRAVTAIPAHASNAVFMGIFLSHAKQYEYINKSKSTMFKIFGLVVPTILHGIYDTLAFSNALLFLIMFITTFFTITVIYVKDKQKKDLRLNSYNIE